MTKENEIIEYGVTDAALAELKSNYSIVPDANTEKGYNDIKSALKVVSPYRKKIEDKRVELKADSLEYGRKIDAEAKRITALITDIEDPLKKAKKDHDDEVKRLEAVEAEKEAAVLAEIQTNLANVKSLSANLSVVDAGYLQERLDEAKAVVIDEDTFGGFTVEAQASLDEAIEVIEKVLSERVEFDKQKIIQATQQAAMDAKQAEFDAKQAEQDAQQKLIDDKEAAQKQKEREAEIAKVAEEKAVKDAELKAQAEKEAGEKREADLKREADETEARVKREAEEKKQREAEEAEAREANNKHKGKINNAAVKELVKQGMDKGSAKEAVTLIAKRLIPNITISY